MSPGPTDSATAAAPAGALRRNLRLCTLEGLAAMPIVFLSVPGNLVLAALLTQVLGLSATAYGAIVSLPAWTNALQIVLTPLLARRFSPKMLALGGAWWHLAVWTLLLLTLPFLREADQTAVARGLFVMFLAMSLTGSVAGIGWTSWVQEWVPARVRGAYFGARNRLMSFATVTFLILCQLVLARWATELVAYVGILGVALALRVASLLWQAGIVGPRDQAGAPPPPAPPGGLRAAMATLLRERSFRAFILFGCAHGFLMSTLGPLVPIYLFEHLDMPVDRSLVLVILASLASGLGMPVWGRLVDRHGAKPMIVASLILWEVPNVAWVFVTEPTHWILYPLWIWGGFASAGFFLGSFNLLLKLVRPETKTAAVSLHLGVTSVAAAAAPVLAGAGLGWVRAAEGDEVLFFRAVFAVKTVLLLSTPLLLRGLAEPAAATVGDVFGGLRTFRQTLILQGLAILANASPTRWRRRR